MERIRTTVVLSEEAHRVFSEMARLSRTSMANCVGMWLDDTVEAAHLTLAKMLEARAAPAKVLRELQEQAASHERAVADLLQEVSAGAGKAGRSRSAGRTAGPDAAGGAGGRDGASDIPPPCNTGGKGTPKQTRSKGKP